MTNANNINHDRRLSSHSRIWQIYLFNFAVRYDYTSVASQPCNATEAKSNLLIFIGFFAQRKERVNNGERVGERNSVQFSIWRQATNKCIADLIKANGKPFSGIFRYPFGHFIFN